MLSKWERLGQRAWILW
jgi:hypothetical protein